MDEANILAFDRACEEIAPDTDDYSSENCIEWLRGQKEVTVQLAAHSKLCNKIERYAEEFPDEVKIVGRNGDTSVIAHIPLSYVHLTRPPKREMSDEQRQAAVERLAKAREAKKEDNNEQ